VHATVSADEPTPKIAAPVVKSDTPHRILFVGASYTAGIGAEPATNGYAYLTAKALDWQGRYDAVPGSGYLNPGPPVDGRPVDNTFASRLERVATTPAPDIVLLQGGRNDGAYPSPSLREAVTHAVDVAHRRFEHAHVVLLGPIPANFPPSHEELSVAHVLHEVAQQSGALFVDPIAEGWITTENARGYIGQVPAHPDNAGYAFIAKRLVEDIDKLLGATTDAGQATERATS
jgi:lysophospholipase L1-like esterase